jgi:ADP-heptose:LPS heptosyltransferase
LAVKPAVLVLRALGLGDMLTAVPALRGLRAAYPDRRLLLAAPARFAPLLRWAGAGDAIIDTAGLRHIDRAGHGAQLAVNMHGRGPESHGVIESARPRSAIGFRHELIPWSLRQPSWRADEHEVHRWCRLLAENGIPADSADLAIRPPGMPMRDPRVTIVHPGAASVARRWPAARFAEVAAGERRRGYQVIVTGGEFERGLAERVAAAADLPASAVAAGRTDLAALVRLIGSAGRLVCGDTGVAHLATALGTPSVVLFGPTAPSSWGPPDTPWHRTVWRGRVGDPHASHTHEGLLEITVAEVRAELEELSRRRALAA